MKRSLILSLLLTLVLGTSVLEAMEKDGPKNMDESDDSKVLGKRKTRDGEERDGNGKDATESDSNATDGDQKAPKRARTAGDGKDAKGASDNDDKENQDTEDGSDGEEQEMDDEEQEMINLITKNINNPDQLQNYFFEAVDSNFYHAAKTLIETNKVDVNAPVNALGITPLRIAANRGYDDICRLLIPLVDQTDFKDPYLVEDAIIGCSLEVFQQFITAGVDVNAVDKYGNTALHSAAEEGKSDICLLLLRHDANPDQKNHAGKTPRTINPELIEQCERELRFQAMLGLMKSGALQNARQSTVAQVVVDDQKVITKDLFDPNALGIILDMIAKKPAKPASASSNSSSNDDDDNADSKDAKKADTKAPATRSALYRFGGQDAPGLDDGDEEMQVVLAASMAQPNGQPHNPNTTPGLGLL